MYIVTFMEKETIQHIRQFADGPQTLRELLMRAHVENLLREIMLQYQQFRTIQNNMVSVSSVHVEIAAAIHGIVSQRQTADPEYIEEDDQHIASMRKVLSEL